MKVFIGFVNKKITLFTFSRRTGWGALSLLPWFAVLLFLPFIGVAIILRRPVKQKKIHQPFLNPVSSEEIFDPELKLEEPRRISQSEIQFLARA